MWKIGAGYGGCEDIGCGKGGCEEKGQGLVTPTSTSQGVQWFGEVG